MPARVIVLAGPSGSGKSRLAERLGLPVLRLDDFYREGDDPALPRLPDGGVDWDDPGSWLADQAFAAIGALCRARRVEVPVYDIPRNAVVARRDLCLGGAPFFVAEGIFAPEVVRWSSQQGLLADAVCVRHHRLVTFWRRLTRDLREHRKPPMVLLRRGWRLLWQEPHVVARAVSAGCVPMRPKHAEARLRRLLARAQETTSQQ